MNAHEKLIWTDEMSIGNRNVDKDHQKLMKIYNDLLELTNKGYSSNEFSRILSDMTDYTMFHFKKEEAYMTSFSYPEFRNHRNEHVQEQFIGFFLRSFAIISGSCYLYA